MDKEIQSKIDQVFEDYDRPDSPGCAVGIVQEGELVYSRGYGMADLEAHFPITPDTVFHLASVSKQFTAASIALLEEAGDISLRDPVRKYIPFLPEAAHGLTLGHLVYMTNGLEDFYDVTSFIMGIPEGNYFSAREAVRIIRAANWLKFPPGEQWSYGNTGYFLLACIVEFVSGQPFDLFVKQHVFEPLGMMNTFVRTNRFMEIPRRAKGYARLPHGPGPDASAPDFSYQLQNEQIEFGGAGQAWSSVNDLVKWECNFFNNRLGGKKSRLIAKMSRPGRLDDGTPTHYAYGQFIRRRSGLKVIFHEGGAAGVNTVLYRIPQKKLSIICLANLSDFLTAQLRKFGEECYERVAGIVSPWPQPAAEPSQKADNSVETETEPGAAPGVPRAVLESLQGKYQDPLSSYIWEVSLEGSKVCVLENYSNRFTLVLEKTSEDSQFSFRSTGLAVSGFFDLSKPGPCTEIQVRLGDGLQVFQRFLSPSLAIERLKEYEGIYTCHPLEVSYRVHSEPLGVRLENLKPANTFLNLVFTPTIVDMFLARYPPLIGWYVLHFKRDPDGQISAFSFRDEVPVRENWVFSREK